LQAHDAFLFAIQPGNVDQGGDRLLSGWGLANHVQPTGQQARLDFHQLDVDLAHQVAAIVRRQFAGIHLRQDHIAIQVADPRRLDDRVDNLHRPTAVLLGLVGADQFAQFLQPLVQTGILGGRGEVADGFGIAASLGDRRLRGVVGGVVVEVRRGANQAVGIAGTGHAHLLTGHKFQGPVGAEVQHRICAPDFL
jgi:hypothetical protein